MSPGLLAQFLKIISCKCGRWLKTFIVKMSLKPISETIFVTFYAFKMKCIIHTLKVLYAVFVIESSCFAAFRVSSV